MRPAVLITGASAGIGAACARLAAAAGWDVGIGYNSDRAGAEATLAAVESAGGKGALLQADVSSDAGVAALMAGWDAAFPTMNALINNAGIVAPAERLEDMSHDRIARIMAVNVTGPLLVAGACVKRMSTDHGGTGGSIVMMSSASARLGSPNLYIDYAASKGGIDTATTGLALEVAPQGIRVNAIRPGLIETAIHGKGGDPDRAQRLASTVPMSRTGSAEEVAEAAIWLISDQASYVTGTFVDVSGGR